MPTQFIEAAKQAALTAAHTQADVPEVHIMAASLTKKHGADAMHLAGLVLLTSSMLEHHGAQSGVDVGALVSLQWDCVRAWADEQGIPLEAVTGALASLARAGQTAQYLRHVPN
ncbi:hypothetical protein [Noviherbaspirillum sedimenti]|uniref:Uncharacterized protein n=1 Tax=Noviherbaspirillum sedimenti TaxID=2320865 RepID=A0A3A3FXI5_9BURK|nr:hypothetical protein [Noviherbaspirillum sedimenti]RJG00331.1 hypothetical protein D3878_01030 [Noviherbaspirillum sedimenti]